MLVTPALWLAIQTFVLIADRSTTILKIFFLIRYWISNSKTLQSDWAGFILQKDPIVDTVDLGFNFSNHAIPTKGKDEN